MINIGTPEMCWRMHAPFLCRPEPPPSLDECWEPPPHFNQTLPKGRIWTNAQREIMMSSDEIRPTGLNAEWRVDLCLFRRSSVLLPFPPLLYARVRVRHSQLIIDHAAWPRGIRIRVPLVDISFIELVGISDKSDDRRRAATKRQDSTGRMLIRGRGLFKMIMFLSAQTSDDLIAIRDWLRFLVIRQRIPHLVLGLQFEWAKNKKKSENLWKKRFLPFIRTIRDKFRVELSFSE